MKAKYVRRADWGDMPLEVKLGILQTELDEYTETAEEKKNALAAIEHLKETIKKFEVKPFVGDYTRPWETWNR